MCYFNALLFSIYLVLIRKRLVFARKSSIPEGIQEAYLEQSNFPCREDDIYSVYCPSPLFPKKLAYNHEFLCRHLSRSE